MTYLTRTPDLVKPLARDLLWHGSRQGRSLHLTFDDGPIPEVTPWVLDRLSEHGAKATFFCVGRNAADHPAILDRIRAEGHAVGNHTWDHANGWSTTGRAYLRSVLACDAVVGSRLFRPPYGRITRGQVSALKKRFRIVMWDVLSADFDTTIDGARCVDNMVRHVRPGSIVVLHDSLKAWDRLRIALPRALEHFSREGYSFVPLGASTSGAPA
ncbi:MAG: polysaccharide deacetylase family protein [Flavobacteriales bacterium]|nr:polysaccharide deacetylase family protein [Flavobacteriales bacterium]MCB0807640.1 polysaccharide deacetylase family protein [Flavobacteriales bacterium]MCB0812793.1 polysaccharide deacetylase family protein [Flavobacteriales bacterium]MCB0816389.1 polysaccharide deacetylase family protein [Flavobacteriales bacterium]MCB9182158.1 polysaccharide deacetylase family protein [Flavobacteriales bacterium]